MEVKSLEGYRIRYNIIYGISFIIFLSLCILSMYVILKHKTVLSFCGVTLITFMFGAITRHLRETYRKRATTYVIGNIMDSMYTNCKYKLRNGLTTEQILEAGFCSVFDTYKTSNYIYGEYNNVKYEMCSVTGSRKVKKGEICLPTIKGIFLVIEFNDVFEYTKIIKRRISSYSLHETRVLTYTSFDNEFFISSNKLDSKINDNLLKLIKKVDSDNYGNTCIILKENKMYWYINNDLPDAMVYFTKRTTAEQITLLKEMLYLPSKIIDLIK